MTLPILTFHALDSRKSVLSFSPPLFRDAIQQLVEAGRESVALSEVARCLNGGEALPERSFALTFDDGYRSVYEHALPLLVEHKIAATVFPLISDPRWDADLLQVTEGRPILSWSEIREMHAAGIEFGAHTLTHPHLPNLPAKEIEREMRESKDVIEQHIGGKVSAFAYPFGAQDAICRGLAAQHFACACSDRLGLVNPKTDRYALERIDTFYFRTPRKLSLLFGGLFDPYLKALSLPRNIRRRMSQAIWQRI